MTATSIEGVWVMLNLQVGPRPGRQSPRPGYVFEDTTLARSVAASSDDRRCPERTDRRFCRDTGGCLLAC